MGGGDGGYPHSDLTAIFAGNQVTYARVAWQRCLGWGRLAQNGLGSGKRNSQLLEWNWTVVVVVMMMAVVTIGETGMDEKEIVHDQMKNPMQ